MKHRLVFLVIIALALFAACSSPGAFAPTAQPAPANPDLILATTTSTVDSGLLDALVPDFEKRTGYKVKTVSVGSGQALLLGERGEADVVLSHSPDAEVAWMDAGNGSSRALVMHNDFVLVGPKDDPAGVKGLKIVEALRKLAAAKALFISRGDQSGTNVKELALWKGAGINPKGQSWYQETGAGQGQTLNVASDKGSYALTDRGTFLALKKNLALDILVEKEAGLLNVYHVMTVNPSKSPKINAAGAKAFADYVLSPDGQNLIKNFGVDKYGQPLFIPDAGKTEDQVLAGQ